MTEGGVEEKKQRLLSALEQGVAQVHLDARRPGVLVPENLRSEHHLVLNLSYRFDPPDLSVSDWGVRQTLSFSGRRFTVALPWSAVYAIVCHATRELAMYPDEIPDEMAAAATEKVSAEDLEDQNSAPPRRPLLREVPLETSEAMGEMPAPQQAAPAPKARSHLRLVK